MCYQGDPHFRGARLKKKKRPTEIIWLLQKIHRLELTHKRSLTRLTFFSYWKRNAWMLHILDMAHFRHEDHMHRILYEFGNKTSRPLVLSVRTKSKCTFISKPRCPKKSLVYTFEDIAQTFQEYKKTLYKISNPFTVPTNTTGRS